MTYNYNSVPFFIIFIFILILIYSQIFYLFIHFSFYVAGNPEEFCYPGNVYNNNLKLSGFYGTLQSPAERYYPHLSCTWLIVVPEGNIIELSFQTFRIPKGPSSKCTPDYVEALDGKDSSSDSKGRLCGYDIPERIRSTGRYMMVRFRSGEIMTITGGFSAAFRARDEPGESEISRVGG